jgi:hypothetical protein
MGFWRFASAMAVAAVLSGTAVQAEGLPLPQGEVILTVTGAVDKTNAGDAVQIDLAMLESMTPVEFETSTIWTDGPQLFRGVPLATLVQHLGAEGTVMSASALNDYTVDIPLTDAVADGPILAFAVNGAPLSVRDKGPLWVVYPYDSNSDYQAEVIYARSIWQVAKIEFK